MRRQKQESNIVQKCNIPVKPQRTLRPIHLVIVGLFCFALGLLLVLLISFALREDAPPATNTPDVTTAVTTAATTTAPITPETPSDVATPVSQGLVFTSNGDGTCSVSGIGTCTDVEILIPESSPVGETVTGIAAGAFDGCAMISSVRIPATVADIDAGAFLPCSSLLSILVDDENPYYQSIGGDLYTKDGKTLLRYAIGKTEMHFEIPATVVTVADDAFNGASLLSSVTIPDSVTAIGYGAFTACTSLNSIAIPGTVESVGDSAFYHCISLAEVSFAADSRLTSIGESAFEDCPALASIAIPDTVESIGNDAFASCTSLTALTLPASVTGVGSYAFYDCPALTIYCEAAVKPSGWDANWNCECPVVWNCKSSDVASDGVVYMIVGGIRYGIKDGIATVVRQPSNLTVAAISASIRYHDAENPVASMDPSAFSSCPLLSAITVDGGNQYYCSIDGNLYTKDGKTLIRYAIGKSAARFEIPSAVESIESGAFADCASLLAVTFAEESACVSIGAGAFTGCESLSSITVPASVGYVGIGAFVGCPTLTIYCEVADLPSGWDADWNPDSRPVVMASKGLAYTSNGDGTCFVSGIGDCTDTEIMIPKLSPDGDRVVAIGRLAFSGCTSLTSVMIPTSVLTVGEEAFYSCTSLSSILIPASVETIAGGAFHACTALAALTVDSKNPYYQAIDGNLYSKDGKTLVQYAIGKTATAFEIPASVESIADGAFLFCTHLTDIAVNAENKYYQSIGGNLYTKDEKTLIQYAIGKADATFTVPDSVTAVAPRAFFGTEALTLVTIPESVTEMGNDVFVRCSRLTVYCDAASQPSGWAKDWNPEECPVEWGSRGLAYTLSTDGTYYIVSGIGSCIDTDIRIPAIYNRLPVKVIGENAFGDCETIVSVTLPDSITAIEANAFIRCGSMTAIHLNEGLLSIGNWAFYGVTSLGEIYIPSTVEEIDQYAYHFYDKAEHLTVHEDNPYYHSDQNCIIETATNTLLFGCKSSIIPSDVSALGPYSFNSCLGLLEIVIPASVTSVSEAAFWGCSNLTLIYCEAESQPAGWENGWSQGCPVVWDCNHNNVDTEGGIHTLIDGIRYRIKDGAATVTGATRGGSYVSIPASVEYGGITYPVTGIGKSAFYGFDTLTSVTIPTSVTSIGYDAFRNCPLLTIYCAAPNAPSGWDADWNHDDLPVLWGWDPYTREGERIYFGEYPQSEVTGAALKSTLNAKAGTLPTLSNMQAWTSYGYYDDGYVSNYMWYIDITEGGERYRGVYFYYCRPQSTDKVASVNNTNQYDNGYYTGTVYWFKYEPIAWTVLSEGDGKALILCDMIIDSREYDFDGAYSNNYAESTIRAWLNDTFYKTAFNDLQKGIILTTTVDNSEASAIYTPNPNTCEDTEDKIFLLSLSDMCNSAYGFSTDPMASDAARKKSVTDYALAQGIRTYDGEIGAWWLRSPYFEDTENQCKVGTSGNAYGLDYANRSDVGVVPALEIWLCGTPG